MTGPVPTDFTEAAYRALLEAAARRFRLVRFADAPDADGIALWRHDIDFSPQRAAALARIEAGLGCRATYFVMLASPFYNAFEPAVRALLAEIAALGHDIGLHFDAGAAGRGRAETEATLGFQAATLGRLLGVPVRAFSVHNPTVEASARLEEPVHTGLVNASAPHLYRRFSYCSDSNGVWRFRPLAEVIADPATVRLYALTHPEWWPPAAMPPRRRVQRCIDGRAAACAAYYDGLLAAHCRPNIGP